MGVKHNTFEARRRPGPRTVPLDNTTSPTVDDMDDSAITSIIAAHGFYGVSLVSCHVIGQPYYIAKLAVIYDHYITTLYGGYIHLWVCLHFLGVGKT